MVSHEEMERARRAVKAAIGNLEQCSDHWHTVAEAAEAALFDKDGLKSAADLTRKFYGSLRKLGFHFGALAADLDALMTLELMDVLESERARADANAAQLKRVRELLEELVPGATALMQMGRDNDLRRAAAEARRMEREDAARAVSEAIVKDRPSNPVTMAELGLEIARQRATPPTTPPPVARTVTGSVLEVTDGVLAPGSTIRVVRNDGMVLWLGRVGEHAPLDKKGTAFSTPRDAVTAVDGDVTVINAEATKKEPCACDRTAYGLPVKCLFHALSMPH